MSAKDHSRLLIALKDKALFYPCCGSDLDLPIKLFAAAISEFFFVDLKRPPHPRIAEWATNVSKNRTSAKEPSTYQHLESGRRFRVHRWQRRAETVLADLPELGVFFYRGDTPVEGEGSSGVRWLAGGLFRPVLDLLVPNGLIVTDGSNAGPGGASQLSAFHDNMEIGEAAVSKASPFHYRGRPFTCVGYVGQRYGPTLVWRVGARDG